VFVKRPSAAAFPRFAVRLIRVINPFFPESWKESYEEKPCIVALVIYSSRYALELCAGFVRSNDNYHSETSAPRSAAGLLRIQMENMTMSSVATAALLNETVPALNSPAVHGTASTIGLFFLGIAGVSLALLILLRCGLPVLGFVSGGILLGSFAAGWMSFIGVVAAGSLFALLQSIAMGGVSGVMVLLCIFALVSLVVGAFEAIVWLFHALSSSALLHTFSAWLVGYWNSASAWVHHLWSSGALLHTSSAWLVGYWNSASAWVHHLWNSIPAHHKWKILYT
jgi:hypothetical protein